MDDSNIRAPLSICSRKVGEQLIYRHRRSLCTSGNERGYDVGKMVKGRKRFIVVDTQSLLLAVYVCAASVSEKAGAMKLLEYIKKVDCLNNLCSRIELVWVDGGYRGEDLINWVKNLWNWT